MTEQITTIVIYGVRLKEEEALRIFEDWQSRKEQNTEALFIDTAPEIRLFTNKTELSYQSGYFEPGYQHVFGVAYAEQSVSRMDNLTYAVRHIPKEAIAQLEVVQDYLENMLIEPFTEVIIINQYLTTD